MSEREREHVHLGGGPAAVCWGGTAGRRIWGQMLGRDGRPLDLGPDVGEGQAVVDMGPYIGEGRPLPLDPGAPPCHLLPRRHARAGVPSRSGWRSQGRPPPSPPPTADLCRPAAGDGVERHAHAPIAGLCCPAHCHLRRPASRLRAVASTPPGRREVWRMDKGVRMATTGPGCGCRGRGCGGVGGG
jgi:hypothetical protein